MKKLSKKQQFKIFKEEFQDLCNEFGIKHWDIFYLHKDLDNDAGARVVYNDHDRWIQVILDRKEEHDTAFLKKLARHEFGHLLSNDILCLAERAIFGTMVTRQQCSDVSEEFANRMQYYLTKVRG